MLHLMRCALQAAIQLLLCLSVAALPGCDSGNGFDPLDPLDQREPVRCVQTYEFGNFGCARVFVQVDGPPTPWPALYRGDIRVVPIRQQTGLSLARMEGLEDTRLEVLRWQPAAPGTGDTVAVWVVARMLDLRGPLGPTLPIFAADSVRHVLRFTAVGQRPPVDTVRLTLR